MMTRQPSRHDPTNLIGRRVYFESDNNGPIWRGTVTGAQDNGCVWVRWDGDIGEKLVDAETLETDQ